jgi:epoxyqueuosine reductase
VLFPESLLKELNIGDWGYSEEIRPRSFDHYHSWVKRGDSSPLSYLEDHRLTARESLTSVLPDAQSALVFLFNYHPQKLSLDNLLSKLKSPFRMASYVFGFEGRDYHDEIKARLIRLGEYIENDYEGLNFQVCLDTHPVLERDLALRSGLGWFGKNSMLISRKMGSFTIIGSLVLDQKISELDQRRVETDHCGQCRACIEACPTDAIDEDNRQIIANKCISTFTIEMFKEEATAPTGMKSGQGEIFGCDICQDVCPWNTRAERVGLLSENQDSFTRKNELIIDTFFKQNPSEAVKELEGLSNGAYKRRFKGTPLERTGRVGMLKNLKFWLS